MCILLNESNVANIIIKYSYSELNTKCYINFLLATASMLLNLYVIEFINDKNHI